MSGRVAILLTTAALSVLSCSARPDYPAAEDRGGEVAVSVRKLSEGRPVFFSYWHEGKKLDYFLVRKAGAVESYMDACPRCFGKKLGFEETGGVLRCRACGVSYGVDDLKGVGSCRPLPLEGELRGETYFVRKGDLVKNSRFF